MRAEAAKRLDLVAVLSGLYGMKFRRSGERYISRSPFTTDRQPSFYVYCAGDGHWVFKDFSSKQAGTLIDIVQMKEKVGTVSAALVFIETRIVPYVGSWQPVFGSVAIVAGEAKESDYDVDGVFAQSLGNTTGVVRDYLVGRGIDSALVDGLVESERVIHCRYKGRSYCSFVVRDRNGWLWCLDNHSMDESGRRFVLGRRTWFSLEHDRLADSQTVYVCESVTDYLSVKTLEGADTVGVALLGSEIRLPSDLFTGVRRIVSVLDTDTAGVEGYIDLQSRFPDKEFSVYPMGNCKDANEYLQQQRREGTGRHLTAEEKLTLYEEFSASDNKKALAQKWGINRSHMYEIVKDARQMVLEGFSDRRVGRKRNGEVQTLDEANERIAALKEERRSATGEKETYYARSEFLKIRLKWAEAEIAELRGEIAPKDEDVPKISKRQPKKKEKAEAIVALDAIVASVTVIGRCAVIAQMPYSNTQVGQWRHEIRDRSPRQPKRIAQSTVENAVDVITALPYLSGPKGQAYMLYHRLGVISQSLYKQMKKKVRMEVFREVSQRTLLPERADYTHVRATEPNQIWAEDFTALPVEGYHFSLAVVVDVKANAYLGTAVERRACAGLVKQPLDAALAICHEGPKDFVISDNGSQYLSRRHKSDLDVAGIVHKRIPACQPRYNGSAECGIKEFKQLFYCLWASFGDSVSPDENTALLLRVKRVVELTRIFMNEHIPRPSLGGVTPKDVLDNVAEEKVQANRQYREQESRKEVHPWTKPLWQTIADRLKARALSNLQLMTAFCFFLKRSLRKLADVHKGVLGNFEKIFPGFP